MTFNRLAVYGHRGWASSAITNALIGTGAPVKVLHRPGSDVTGLPVTVSTVEVDVSNEAALVSALEDVDILISLVGGGNHALEHDMIKALPHTNVALFCPSDLAFLLEDDAKEIPILRAKAEVKHAAKSKGVAIVNILVDSFAESCLDCELKGVDLANNTITFTGASDRNSTNLCTRAYVAAGYASIFAQTPVKQLRNRSIGLSELTPTGSDIMLAMEGRFGNSPKQVHRSIEDAEKAIQANSPVALAAYARKIWGQGRARELMGDDIWTVPGYQKATLRDLIVLGKMEKYKQLPPFVVKLLKEI